jgi:hypothetical protein
MVLATRKLTFHLLVFIAIIIEHRLITNEIKGMIIIFTYKDSLAPAFITEKPFHQIIT